MSPYPKTNVPLCGNIARWRWPLCSALLALSLPLPAQEAPAADSSIEDAEEIIQLSPFEVTAEDSDGYSASTTLAGTRVRTDLRDIAASISVVTAEFLEDTGSHNNQGLLVYTTGTEVGGLFGNFSGVSAGQGPSESKNLVEPSSNTRVRGLSSADNTRDYFQSDVPWDSYNVERVDLQRGPNSILFGVGSPSGIINNTTTPAIFKDTGKIQFEIDQESSLRSMFNVNQELIDNTLAVRVAGVVNNRKFQQKPAFEDTERFYAAVRYDARVFGDNHGSLTVRANFEAGEVDANRPRQLPPVDQITPWWTGMGQQTYDPQWGWNSNAVLDRGNSGKAGANQTWHAPWLGNDMGGMGTNPVFFFNPGAGVPFEVAAMDAAKNFGIGSNGQIDRGINAWQFLRMMDVAGFNEYSRNADASARAQGQASPYPGALRDFYKDKMLQDPGVFDFYNNLIDGDNKREWQEWDVYNISLAQTFFDNRFGLEFVLDEQEYTSGSESLWGGSTSLGIDINSHTTRIPTAYPARPEGVVPAPGTVSGGELNPNVGRAYVNSSGGGGSARTTTRENLRVTAFAELKGSDFFREDSFLEKLVGRHVVTGLYSTSKREEFSRNWNLFAMDLPWGYANDSNPASLTLGNRGLSNIFYLSDDLRGVASPANLGLSRVNSFFDPHGNYDVRYFDSNWKYPLDPGAAGYVDPAQPYSRPYDGGALTQAENWQNYRGWTTGGFNVLNARQGDRDSLYSSANRTVFDVESLGVTLQSYLLDGHLVPTWGWREDTVENYGSLSVKSDVTDVADITQPASKSVGFDRTTGESITWGVVAHLPDVIQRRLPGETKLSFFYNDSTNFNPAPRVGFDTNPIEPPQGFSKDYGFVVSTLNDRIVLKTTIFETGVDRDFLPGGSALGSNAWFLYRMEAFAVAAAFQHELYWRGELGGFDWNSNYALIDANKWGNGDWIPDRDTNDANALDQPGYRPVGISDEAWNHPSMAMQFAAILDAFDNARPQEFYDRYGLPVNIAMITSLADRRKMIANGTWNPVRGVAGVDSSTGGRVNGLSPTAAIDTLSKGIEIELTARIRPNWNMTFNVTKTEASRGDLDPGFTAFIEDQYERLQGPMGDLRLWWGGDPNYRTYYDQFIWQPYLFQKAQKGAPAPEIRKWRFNLVTNYQFEEGAFKGTNVGLGYRWQDDLIVGNELNTSDPNDVVPDFTRPILAGAEDALDLWVGYSRKLTEKINWKIQVNVRGVGQSDRLIPVSINPDGSYATVRIGNGQSWSLSNTFSF